VLRAGSSADADADAEKLVGVMSYIDVPLRLPPAYAWRSPPALKSDIRCC